jgi:hypothetical protein
MHELEGDMQVQNRGARTDKTLYAGEQVVIGRPLLCVSAAAAAGGERRYRYEGTGPQGRLTGDEHAGEHEGTHQTFSAHLIVTAAIAASRSEVNPRGGRVGRAAAAPVAAAVVAAPVGVRRGGRARSQTSRMTESVVQRAEVEQASNVTEFRVDASECEHVITCYNLMQSKSWALAMTVALERVDERDEIN